MIYFRNNPSILFWEAGNTVVTPDHMTQMVDLRKEVDPHGMRVMGCPRQRRRRHQHRPQRHRRVLRRHDRPGSQRTDELTDPTDMFRAYSAERRDRAPLIETEDFRDEAARRFWDDFSPPYFGFKKGPKDTYNWNSETFALAGAVRYNAYWSNRISNPDAAHAKWSGYASIYFSDSDADGRQDSTEVARVCGKVDAVRLPKEIYFASPRHAERQPRHPHHRPLDLPRQHHQKTIYVIANSDIRRTPTQRQIPRQIRPPRQHRLRQKQQTRPRRPKRPTGFVFAFPNIHFAPGTLTAIGYNKSGKKSPKTNSQTAGNPPPIKLTPITVPAPASTPTAPTSPSSTSKSSTPRAAAAPPTKPASTSPHRPRHLARRLQLRQINSTNNLYLNIECGINRVAIRSTLTPGKITLTATRNGLKPHNS